MKLTDPNAPKTFLLVGGPLDGATIPTHHLESWPGSIVVEIGELHQGRSVYDMTIGVVDEYHHRATSWGLAHPEARVPTVDDRPPTEPERTE
jgi:hypothetical protein